MRGLCQRPRNNGLQDSKVDCSRYVQSSDGFVEPWGFMKKVSKNFVNFSFKSCAFFFSLWQNPCTTFLYLCIDFLILTHFYPPQIILTQKFPRIWSPYYFWCPIPPLQYDYKAPSVTYSSYILTWSTFIRLRLLRCYIEICHKSWKKLCYDGSLTFLFRKKVVIRMLLQLLLLLSAYLFFSLL